MHLYNVLGTYYYKLNILFNISNNFALQVVIVGNGAVGKSSLIQRYCRGVYTKGYKKTIGVDFLEKHLRY